MPSEPSLEILVGEPINGVAFIMDYVEVYFNGPVLRCIANPTVRTSSGVSTFPENGSRDALCTLIGDSPSRIDLAPELSLTVHMTSGTVLTVPLDAAHSYGGESINFVPGINRSVLVW